jgi:hypothetical protein
MIIDSLKPSVWSLRAAAAVAPQSQTQLGHHLNAPNHLEFEVAVQLLDGRPSTFGDLRQSPSFITPQAHIT